MAAHVKDKPEIKPGFKKTKLGWIPEEWDNSTIGSYIKFTGGSQPPRSTFIFEERIGYSRLIQTRDYRTDKYKTYIKSDSTSKFCNEDDVMIGRYGPPIFQIFRGLKGAYNVALIKAVPKTDSLHKNYMWYFLNRRDLRAYLESLSQRSGGQTGLEMDLLKSYGFPVPPLPEQKDIANCLSTWDTAITKLDTLIKAKQQLKKALMQQLLSGATRLPGFDGEWSTWTFEELFKKVSRPVEWDDEETYELISVRRRSGGLFHRDSLKGYEILTKKLYTAKKGDFLMSKMQILHGASGIVTDEFDNMKISGSYIAVVPKNDGILNMEYMAWYSQTPFFYHQTYRSSYGVHIEKMTFNYNLFKKEEVLIPSVEEQTAIAQVLNTADQEIALLTTQRNQLQLQKKGLMQQLLTGKKRLKY